MTYPPHQQYAQPAGDVPLSAPLRGASAPDAVLRFFKKYATFSGRASRSEYWWWTLVNAIVTILLYLLAVLVMVAGTDGTGETSPGLLIALSPWVVWLLVTLVPGVALTVRRLHDANFSGWIALLGLIPFGGIILLVFVLIGPKPEGQRFDRPARIQEQVTSMGALQAPGPGNVPTGDGGVRAGAAGGINAADGGEAGVTAQSGIPPQEPKPAEPAVPTVDRKRPKVFIWMLALGAVITAGLIFVTALALTSGTGLQQILAGPSAPSPSAGPSTPSPTAGSSTPSPTAGSSTPSPDICGGISRPDLSGGECDLLNRVTSGSLQALVSPESCITNPDPAGASFALSCRPGPGSGFTAADQPKIFIYGYDSPAALNSSFDDLIQRYGAGYGFPTVSPRWDTWKFLEGDTSLQGRILGAVHDKDTNVLVWTDERARAEIWAESSASVQELYNWWTKE